MTDKENISVVMEEIHNQKIIIEKLELELDLKNQMIASQKMTINLLFNSKNDFDTNTIQTKVISDEHIKLKEKSYEEVKQNGMNLRHIHESLQNDIDIVRIAVSNRGESLRYASPELQANFEIVKIAVSNRGESLQFADVRLRNNKELVMQAVNNWGSTLEFASYELRNDKDIVKLACKRDKNAIRFASQELQSDTEFIKTL